MARWRGVAAVALGVAVAALSGCGHTAGAPPLGWPQVLPSFAAIPRIALAPMWQRPLPWPASVAMAPDGSVAAGDGAAGPWAYTASGEPVPLTGGAGNAVFPLDGGMVAVGPGPADPAGSVTLYGAAGALWSAPAVGPVSVVASPDRILVLDSGSGRGTLLSVVGGAVARVPLRGLRSIGPEANGLLDAAGDLLLYNQDGVEWFPADARAPAWTVRAQSGPPVRQLALSADGQYVTAATGQGLDTLYQFSVQGQAPTLDWTEPLPTGGSNLLVVAPNDNVAVWDLGQGPTLAVYRASDGAMLWQDTLSSPPGGAAAIEAVAFGPGDGVLVAVDDCGDGSPCLLFLSAAGAALAYAPVPPGTRLALAADGLAAAGVVPGASPGASSLQWWNLAGVWQGLDGAAAGMQTPTQGTATVLAPPSGAHASASAPAPEAPLPSGSAAATGGSGPAGAGISSRRTGHA